MFRMIIADDEPVIREAICDLIDWNKLGVSIVAVCKNGVEALNAVMDEYPDIVLTDIKMPGFTGLELIEQIRTIDRHIEVIILSGFREFDFAAQAMKFGVKQYLLKPVNEGQIIEAVKLSITEVERTRRLEDSRVPPGAFANIIKDQFVYELFSPKSNIALITEKYESLLPDTDNAFFAAFFTIFDEIRQEDFSRALYQFLNAQSLPLPFLQFHAENSLIAVFAYDQRLSAAMQAFSARVLVKGKQTAVVCNDELYRSFRHCFEQLIPQLTGFHKIGLVHNDFSVREIYNYTSVVLKIQEITRHMLNAAQENDRAAITGFCSDLFVRIHDMEQIRIYGSLLVSNIITEVKETQGTSPAGFFDDIYRETDCAAAKELIQKAVFHVLLAENKTSAHNIEKVKQYIDTHFQDPNLSLKWIASNFLFMNVDYLSRQFTAEAGEKFSVYITRIRMEKAKELLLRYNTGNIHSVAEKIGFGHDPRYFSQVFKKYTGFTPSAFIERAAASGEEEAG